jgi:Beta-propeller repeat/BNR/Asp-box repeat
LLALVFLPVPPLGAASAATRPGLAYSQAFGGSGTDVGVAVATDAAGNVYIAGNTNSPDFPVKNAIQSRLGGIPFRVSVDGGKTWTAAGISSEVDAVAVSPKAPGVLYAAGPGTIYKSSDAGKTWTALPSSPNANFTALVVDANNPSVVYAAGSPGLYKSQDAGATWKRIDPQNWVVLDLVANPARPSTLFAGLDVSAGTASVYRSTDGGVTWTPLTGLPPIQSRRGVRGCQPGRFFRRRRSGAIVGL